MGKLSKRISHFHLETEKLPLRIHSLIFGHSFNTALLVILKAQARNVAVNSSFLCGTFFLLVGISQDTTEVTRKVVCPVPVSDLPTPRQAVSVEILFHAFLPFQSVSS